MAKETTVREVLETYADRLELAVYNAYMPKDAVDDAMTAAIKEAEDQINRLIEQRAIEAEDKLLQEILDNAWLLNHTGKLTPGQKNMRIFLESFRQALREKPNGHVTQDAVIEELEKLKRRVDFAGTGAGFQLDKVHLADFGSKVVDDVSTIYKKDVSDYLATRIQALREQSR